MNTSGDAAESIVRMSLQGLEVAVKLSGSGAKNIAAIMVAMLKDQKQTKGKTRLTNMLKSGKELKVFTVKEEDFRKFTEEAKRYGVLFCALKSKGKSVDGMVDIMVRAEDASKINRIVDRFNLAKRLVDDILSKPISKEENEMSNPKVAKTEKSPLSEPTSNNKNKSDKGTKSEKPSVREEIKSIKEEQKKERDLDKSELKNEKTQPNKTTKHKQPKSKKKKSKERG